MRCVLLWTVACTAVGSGPETARAQPTAPPEIFIERAEDVGVRFVHRNGRSGKFYMPEINGSGCAVFDYDNDGDLDLFFLQGQALVPDATPAAVGAEGGDRLFRNDLRADLQPGAATAASLRFTDVSASAGSAFQRAEVSRGAAFGDLDNDGDTDVVISNNDGPARILINRVGQDSHWLGLRLVGGASGRDLLGAGVLVERRGKPRLHRRVRADGSFASAHDPRLVVGLGSDGVAATVRVRWPDQSVEEWSGIAAGRYRTLRQGTGKRIE